MHPPTEGPLDPEEAGLVVDPRCEDCGELLEGDEHECREPDYQSLVEPDLDDPGPGDTW